MALPGGRRRRSVFTPLDNDKTDALEKKQATIVDEKKDFAERWASLGKVPLFKTLPKDEKPALAAACEPVKFPAGSVIITQGDIGTEFFVITAGEANVTISSADKAFPVKVATLKAGDYFGENALLQDEPRNANIIADSELTTLRITRDKWSQVVSLRKMEQKIVRGQSGFDNDRGLQLMISRRRDGNEAAGVTKAPVRLLEAVGLETSVRAWWRGAHSSGGKSQQAWLRTAAVGGLQRGGKRRLLRSGIPERVLDAGLQLGSFLQADETASQLWQNRGDGGDAAFVSALVDYVSHRFIVRAAPLGLKIDLEVTPGLILMPREDSNQRHLSASEPGEEEKRDFSARMNSDTLRRTPLGNSSGRKFAPPPPIRTSLFGGNPNEIFSEIPSSGLRAKVLLPPPPPTHSSPGSRSAESPLGLKSHQQPQLHSSAEPRFNLEPRSLSRPFSASVTAGESITHRKPYRQSTGQSARSDASMGRPRRDGRKTTLRSNPEQHLSTVSNHLTNEGPKRRSSKREVMGKFEEWVMGAQVNSAVALKKKTVNAGPVVRPVVRDEDNSAASTTDHLTEKDDIRRLFQQLDKDGSGSLEPKEFLPLLSRLMKIPASQMDMSEVWKSWKEVDVDGSGEVDFDEFYSWCRQASYVDDAIQNFTPFFTEEVLKTEHFRQIGEVARKLGIDNVTIEQIWNEFMRFEENQSGRLEFREFRNLLVCQLAKFAGFEKQNEIPTKVVQTFWRDVDSDNSGSVSFEEFAGWYLRFVYGEETPIEQYFSALASPVGSPVASLAAQQRRRSSQLESAVASLVAQQQWAAQRPVGSK